MKISVYLDDDRNIVGVNNTSNYAAENQAKEKGWTLIKNSDPAFSIDEMFKWTVRQSDNKLVHISTGMTPDEETKKSLTNLTKEQLNDSLTKDQLQMALTTLTKKYIEDKANSNLVTTELTRQIADLTIKLDKVMGIDPTPTTPSEVKSVATVDGAVISAQ
ncbi:hypothetical protein [Companilactobacillus bobalius]|uniref:Uncharacterized protein n=2 Tax=Companilactobacillus bobalius TaxID=2801451 RepID=A0A202FEH5_9LACO|nr:hypothetical protein [Companilactobacillus bobalius]KAE9560636.1 hypothetical protein ATN92_10900 [Companilactobacillus bobalius]KAE9564419.1 hypothetical protein ATN92_00530 [Companilactobacillus bobalius]KRK83413.1 hypothetical protein FC78_GL002231 [Companilactobacillus bobalius DSM 19674]OVE98889.1 hypothetical protein LKACC16343_00001 [Companilactobacillus bobalius]